MPSEALFRFDDLLEVKKGTINPYPWQTDVLNVDFRRMNLLEIACIKQHYKLQDFLVNQMLVRHERDFGIRRGDLQISEQNFVYLPILRRDEGTLTTLLELTNLWSMDQLKDIMILCKHMKWHEGISIVLKSKSCCRQYLTIAHQNQNIF